MAQSGTPINTTVTKPFNKYEGVWFFKIAGVNEKVERGGSQLEDIELFGGCNGLTVCNRQCCVTDSVYEILKPSRKRGGV